VRTLYLFVGFIVVWVVVLSLLGVGLASFIDFWKSLQPDEQQLRQAEVELELRKARQRMLRESLYRDKTEQ